MTNKPSKSAAFEIRLVGWQEAAETLSAIRRRVFIEEQQVPESLEWDGLDEDAVHALAISAAGHAIGCARLLPGGYIGRMAVMMEWRRQGVGVALLQQLIEAARMHGLTVVRLSAQTHAIGFYERAGFRVTSDIYQDAGIPHRDMIRVLD